MTGLRSTSEIRAALRRLREEAAAQGGPHGRTSVLTLVAWVPPAWQEAAGQTLHGLAQGHPSRAILLMPRSDSDDPSWSAEVALRPLRGTWEGRAAEVVTVSLPSDGLGAPSIVVPLVRSDLPVFLRWRGPLPGTGGPLESLIQLADRLIVDSSEWTDVDAGYAGLRDRFAKVACSDLAWRRIEPWRRTIATCQPPIKSIGLLAVEGPRIEAELLAAWLRTRLSAEVELDHRDAPRLDAVAVDGEPVPRPRLAHRSPSELLSLELERMTRDTVFEEASCALLSVTI